MASMWSFFNYFLIWINEIFLHEYDCNIIEYKCTFICTCSQIIRSFTVSTVGLKLHPDGYFSQRYRIHIGSLGRS